MGKRTTIAAVSALALLLACIALAVVRLYRPVSPRGAAAQPDNVWSILGAVPSDAAAVLVLDGSAKAAGFAADSTGLLQGLLAPENPAFMKYLQALGRRPVAVSLHNSGALVPLVVARSGEGDSLLQPVAAKAGLKLQASAGYLFASRSETFVSAGIRQAHEGQSILGTRRLGDLCARIDAPMVLLVAHSQAPKLLQMYASKAYRQQASFVKNLTAWSAWTAYPRGKEHLTVKGLALPGEGASSYFTAFAGTPAQQPEFPEVLPYFTATAISIPVAEASAFFAARRKQEDGAGHLVAFNRALKAKDGRPMNPEQWFSSLQPREVVRAAFRDPDGVQREALLLRSGKDLKLGREAANPYTGCLATVLGPDFALPDSVCASLGGKWSVFADLPTVRLLVEKPEYSLKDRLGDASVSLPEGFVAYASLGDEPAVAGRLLAPCLAEPLLARVKGAGFAPVAAALSLEGDWPEMTLQLDTRALKGTKVQVLERDTTVVVPGGLFPVRNSGTGKTNYLYQNRHRSICLRDERNKDLWGVPFKEEFCGRVQTIDYYNNKKLQFLFCAGNKLYVMDRLGRWVNGFPVTLEKPVLLGPDAYDFTGACGYTVMILHKDNTLEQYNLHGQKTGGWKGIHAPETVKNLPELLEVGGKRYWAVRTSVQTLLYPFEGGDPIFRAEGGKMLKPDARLQASAKGISAECYDGKIREFKLN